MREARTWMDTYYPKSFEDILLNLANTETSAKLQMVLNY